VTPDWTSFRSNRDGLSGYGPLSAGSHPVSYFIAHGIDPPRSVGQQRALEHRVKGAQLKIYKGAPHGMCTTLKDQVNADLLAFIEV
jgi:hypothetical protein